MDLAAELAARDMSVNIYIRAETVHITLIKRNGNWAGKAKFRHCPLIFDNIAGEILTLLEGCDE